jgi:hypothetical protein
MFEAMKGSSSEPSGLIQVPIAQPIQGDPNRPMFVTSAGVPVAPSFQPSEAEASFDGWRGVSSCDPLLHMDQSGFEIVKYLNTYNSRPTQYVSVHGHHQETRTRTVSSTDSNGNRTTRTEHYTVTVTDFIYKIDITHFIFPFGYIQTDNGETIPAAVDCFLADTSGLKTLKMDKVVAFDFGHLRTMVYGYIRSLGWWRGLTISFPRHNYRVKIWKKTCVSSIWENGCGRCLCYLSLIGCCVMKCILSKHKQSHIKSYYRIDYHPLQVMEMIKPQLWAPGFAAQGLGMMGEFMREAPRQW